MESTTTTIDNTIHNEDLDQTGALWRERRMQYQCPASSISEKIGISPFCSQHKALLVDLGIEKKEFGIHQRMAMKHGTDMEPIARDLYEILTNENVTKKGIFEYSFDKRFSVSPDGVIYIDNPKDNGLTCFKEGIIEIKCPYSAAKENAKQESIDEARMLPLHYIPQLMAGMKIIGVDWCDYICYVPDVLLKVNRIYFDENVWSYIYEEVCKYLKELKMIKDGEKKIENSSIQKRNINKRIIEDKIQSLFSSGRNKGIKTFIKGRNSSGFFKKNSSSRYNNNNNKYKVNKTK